MNEKQDTYISSSSQLNENFIFRKPKSKRFKKDFILWSLIITLIIIIFISLFLYTYFRVIEIRRIKEGLTIEEREQKLKIEELTEQLKMLQESISNNNKKVNDYIYLNNNTRNFLAQGEEKIKEQKLKIKELEDQKELLKKRIYGYKEEGKYLDQEIRIIHINEFNNNK